MIRAAMPATSRTALVLPCAGKGAEVSQAVAPGAHAGVIVDGAGRHKPGGLLRLPDTVGFPVPPPCCPELDPQDNIRQDLRQNDLSNRLFDTDTTIVDACCDAWNALVAQPGTITSIATRT